MIFCGAARAQSPLWAGLEPGPYAVGFKVMWRFDESRTWQPDKDYEGRKLTVEAARPVRISVWYPARRQSAAPMPYSAYLHVGVPDQRFADFNRGVEDYDQQSVRGYFKSQALVNDLLKTPTAAHLNAPALKGRFPLVVYSLGQNDHTLENTVLWEFLASHGYVVATVPQIGTSPRRFQLLVHDPTMYEAQVRDLEFVIQQMHEQSNVDADRLALAGHSFGGIYSLLTSLRNAKVDAVVGLDPSFLATPPTYFYKFWEAPYYDAARLKAPMLLFYKTEEKPRWDIVEGLRYSDRYHFHFPKLGHGDFNSGPMIQRDAAPEESQDYLDMRTRATAVAAHKFILRRVLNFLDAELKGDAGALHLLTSARDDLPAGFFERKFQPGLKAPDEEALAAMLMSQSYDQAVAAFRAARAKYPRDEIIREPVLKRIGNEFGYYGKPQLAVDAFRLNVEAHPQSADAYDRLAAAYVDVGDKEAAIKSYEKSLALNPQNANANEQLQKLRQR